MNQEKQGTPPEITDAEREAAIAKLIADFEATLNVGTPNRAQRRAREKHLRRARRAAGVR